PTGINTESDLFAVRPKIVITPTPDANTILTVGSSYTNLIKWTYLGDPTARTVEIHYDTGLGGGYVDPAQEIGEAAASAGQFSWNNVPNIISSSVKVRVRDKVFTSALGESAPFKVKGGISNVLPAAGANKTADTTMNVTWDYTGSLANFDVYYSPSSGSPSTTYVLVGSLLSTSCAAGSCSFSWLDTEANNLDTVLNTARVKITNALLDTAPLYVETAGASDFKRGASLSGLTVFNGPIVNVGSTSTDIIWTKLKGLSTTTQMKIDYTTNPDSPTWTPLTAGTDNDASFIWPGVGGVPGTLDDLDNGVKLRITQVTPDNSVVTAESGVLVVRAVITMVEPTGSGSESWGLLENHDIKFKVKGNLNTVNIYYAPDGSTYEVLPINTAGPINVSATGLNCNDGVATCTWTWSNIPANTLLSTSGYNSKIKVKAEDPLFQKTSDAQGISGGFQIRGSITAVTPTNNTNLLVGTPVDIVWTPVGNILAYDVQYSYSMVGASWNAVPGCTNVAGVDAGGGNKKCNWASITDTISNKVLFRVFDHDRVLTSFDSGTFALGPYNYIKGQLTIASPTNSDIWTVGTAYNPSIRWNKTGLIGDLKIEYSTSGTFAAGDYSSGYVFTVANNLASGVDGVNNYSWQAGVIPAPSARKISETGKIRITNLSAPAGTDLTVDSLAFKIRPGFLATPAAFTQPNASTVWYATDTDTVNQVITWASISGTKGDGNPPACLLEYTTDGTNYTLVPGAGALGCAQGISNYTWSPMADLKSNSVRVRATYADFTGPTGINTESDLFAVRPKIV
ncbi:MAG: hypothetical protein AAB327_04715, partial [Actinomycetota bacterium]